MPNDMKTILVTGPIGGGKSEVCRYLESKGFPVYDSDSRTKHLYRSVPGLLDSLEEALGVPFREFGIIFSDSSKREKLEEIVYPLVADDIQKWKEAQKGAETVFIESAVAAGKDIFKALYDEVWLIDAPLDVRKARNPKAAVRDGIQSFNREEASKIIINDASISELHKKIDKLS